MAGDWAKVQLRNVCVKIGSGATPRGGKEAYKGGSTSLIRSQNIYNDGFHRSGLVHIDDTQAAELRNVEIKENDVLLNITGDSVARCCQVAEDVLPARVNQHVAIIRPRSESLDAQFLRYVLVTGEYQSHLLTLASAGATRPALTKTMIETLEVPLPPLPEQKAIASVLGTLDDLIELNRETNEILEEMARALFKSWFVDFDPVRAKLEGRPPAGMDAATAALFPDHFQDSELGQIPKGWEVKSLDEIANFLNGLALQKFPANDGPTLPVIKIAQLRKGDVAGADRCNMNVPTDFIIQDGDVLFSWSGTLAVEIWCGGNGALNQHLFKVTSAEFPKWFYLIWTRQHLEWFQSVAADKAVTMGHIKRGHLTEAKVVIPSGEIIDAMTAIMAPIIEQIISNRIESRDLAILRDTLLPKLLSGELSVSELQEELNP